MNRQNNETAVSDKNIINSTQYSTPTTPPPSAASLWSWKKTESTGKDRKIVVHLWLFANLNDLTSI